MLRFIRVVLVSLCLCHAAYAVGDGDEHYAYQRLKTSLALYQEHVIRPWPLLPAVGRLELGYHHPAVAILRQRLCATNDLPVRTCHAVADRTYFDEQLEQGLMRFQERHGLVADGIVGQATRHSLNISPQQRVRQIQLNLQRHKNLLGLGKSLYLWVNIPDHRLRLMKDQKVIFVSRIIVGKLSQQTPEMSSEVTRIILNPHWTVPPGIARRDVIPRILKNRDYLRSHQMRIFAVDQPKKELDPDSVDWLAVARDPKRYILRQDPGPHNALGQIKFDFSNPHAVYLHDTPARHLFDEEKRLFSSGCIRLEDPLDLLDELVALYPSMQKSESQMESALSSGKTVVIRLKEPIPLYVTYFTAWVDHIGVVHFWDDVYGRDVGVLDDPVTQTASGSEEKAA